MRSVSWIALLLTLLVATAASAHKPSDSYLRLTVGDRQVDGRWDIALRDLEHAIGIDGNGDGAITWGEVKSKHAAIAAYVLARLEIGSSGALCPTTATGHQVERHSDGAYAVLRFVADCPSTIGSLDVVYRLLAGLDPLHRGLVQVRAGEATHAGVLGPDRPAWRIALASPDLAQQFRAYFEDGVWHIWIGIDHILFLLCLLLPALGVRPRAASGAFERPAPSLIDIVKIVTAFTVAHSITLALAALDVVDLPARLVESAIAASVALAALNNLYPLVTRRLWLVAFGFGLIHGFGFASVLSDLALPQGSLLVALLSFNLGVEAGQLVLVLLFLGVCRSLARLGVAWPRWAAPVPSLMIGAIAVVWLVERAFGVSLAG